MKAIKLVLALLASGALTGTAAAQVYSIDWHSIDGGGGTSSGGNYTLTGTIGQPDAGTMSGGNYTLTGGFMSIVAAVQTPGAPTLSVTRSGANVIVSWPEPSTGFVLQEAGTLVNPVSWSSNGDPQTVNGTNRLITIPSPTGNKFFRLQKP